ncbi:uncharacterized protein LOC130173122 [Seriola aureovittata]|uniref:uncharacterized protein LOC130173122 n=1 Tax=Seriola aureovittata TaxID=2871759 RepID=UPI0024BEB12E|nr:uncharacterized protein LOC130173122 [Seriola aureovittata]
MFFKDSRRFKTQRKRRTRTRIKKRLAQAGVGINRIKMLSAGKIFYKISRKHLLPQFCGKLSLPTPAGEGHCRTPKPPDRGRQHDSKKLDRGEMSSTNNKLLWDLSPEIFKEVFRDACLNNGRRLTMGRRKIYARKRFFNWLKKLKLWPEFLIIFKKVWDFIVKIVNIPNSVADTNTEHLVNMSPLNGDLIKQARQKLNCDEVELQNELEEHPFKIEHMAIEKHLIQEQDQISQFAFAIVHMKDDIKIFNVVKPDHKKNNTGLEYTKHTEELLIDQIEVFLHRKKKKKSIFKIVKNIVIFSYNSPCLNRLDKRECCMLKLLDKAKDWKQYGISTTVVFAKYWASLKYGIIKINGSVDQSNTIININKINNVPFRLKTNITSKYIENKDDGQYKDVFSIIADAEGKEERKALQVVIESSLDHLQTEAEKSSRTYDEHLQHLKKEIATLMFPMKHQDNIRKKLLERWTRVVNYNTMVLIHKRKTAELNIKYFLSFQELLGSSSPLHLKHMFLK